MLKKIMPTALLIALSLVSNSVLEAKPLQLPKPFPGNGNFKFPKSTIPFEASSNLLPIECTGAEQTTSSIIEDLYVIEYPNTSLTQRQDCNKEGPTATIQFTVPKDFDASKKSAITFSFFTERALNLIEGSVKFTANADFITTADGASVDATQNLGIVVKTGVGSSPPSLLGGGKINKYRVHFSTTGLFNPEDNVTVAITRINGDPDNFAASVYEPGAAFIYNK